MGVDGASGGEREWHKHTDSIAKRQRPIAGSLFNRKTEEEAVELAKTHMRDVHGQDYTSEELRSDHLQIV